jgi:DNA-binding NarL/FixJ family response regulator
VTTSLVLAEDSFIVREGIKLLLEQAGGFKLLAVCEDLPELLAAVDEHRPEVVLTDIRMPPTRTDEGIRAARQIRQQYPDIGVVVLSQYVEPEYAISLFSEGSSGLAYLLKERVGDLDHLTNAINQVSAGHSVIDPRVVDVLVQARTSRKENKLARLTDREREVLGEVASGMSNSGIAEKLFLSERAVEKHINSIFTKLDLPQEGDTNRRVRAVLLYLADTKHESW